MPKLRKGATWVDLPKEMLAELPAEGVPAEYRFTETFVDFRPNAAGVAGIRITRWREELAFSATWNIRIKNDVHTVGLVENYDAQGVPDPATIGTLSFKPQANGGRLYLHPTTDENDLNIFYALELHPSVGGNKLEELNGIKTGEKLIVRVDSEAEAVAEREVMARSLQAQSHAMGIKTDGGVASVALVLGIGTSGQSPNQIRAAVERAAKNNPEDYLLRVNDANVELRAEFLNALHMNIVFVDRETNLLKFTGNKGEIIPLTSLEEKDVADQYVAYATTDKQGPNIHKMVMNFVKAQAAKKAV